MEFGNKYFNLWLLWNENGKGKKKVQVYYLLIVNQLKLFSLPPLKLELMRGHPCGNKKINGRKRTILVDTLGLPLAIKVSPANMSDNEAGIEALDGIKGSVRRVQKITADKGYKITFINHDKEKFGWKVEIAQKPESSKGLSLKKIGGKSKGRLVGSISDVDCSKTLKN